MCNQFNELEANQRDKHHARQTSRKQSHDWFKFYIENLTNYTESNVKEVLKLLFSSLDVNKIKKKKVFYE